MFSLIHSRLTVGANIEALGQTTEDVTLQHYFLQAIIKVHTVIKKKYNLHIMVSNVILVKKKKTIHTTYHDMHLRIYTLYS